MNYKLIISKFYNDILLAFLFENDKLVQIRKLEENSVIGNIYCGYVKDVVKNINACFVDFTSKHKGFLAMQKNKYKSGDKVLVQVSSDRVKSKDYVLTTKLEFKNKNLILTQNFKTVSVSKKIKDSYARWKFKQILAPLCTEEYGFIVRTLAENATKDELIADANELIQRFEGVRKKMEHISPKTCLWENNSINNLLDEYRNKYSCEIITDDVDLFGKIENKTNVILNEGRKVSLRNKYALDKHLNNALSKHVWLKSGAYLIIEPTEALTVIDVNTGKVNLNTRKHETVRRINFEAAAEIARQLKIRNLSGIIIVDFINTYSEADMEELKLYFEKEVMKDYSKTYILGFTKLQLMELSRKKVEKPLHEVIHKG